MSLNISDFHLFLWENCNSYLIKVTTSFLASPSKSWAPVKHTLYENMVGGSTPFPCRKGRGGAHYNNSRLAKNHILNRARLSLRSKNIIRNQILVSKLWFIGQIYTIPKYQKRNWYKNIQFPLEQEKIQPPGQWAQLSIWSGRIGILLF